MGFAQCLPLTDPSNVWDYCPSVPAAVLFFALFAISTITHLIQAIKHRTAFCWVITMGALWETLSFASRTISAHEPTKKGIFDASFLLLIISPLLVNALDYMLLGRMVTAFLPENKLAGIRGSKMGVVFVSCDIISFVVQLGGGLLSISKTLKTAQLGLHVYMAGVIFQQLLIITFLGLTIAFQRSLGDHTSSLSSRNNAKTLLHCLRASLALISFRIIFRIIQFAQPQGSSISVFISRHEYFVYLFDAVPMFCAVLIMNIWHPGKALNKQAREKILYVGEGEGEPLGGYRFDGPV